MPSIVDTNYQSAAVTIQKAGNSLDNHRLRRLVRRSRLPVDSRPLLELQSGTLALRDEVRHVTSDPATFLHNTIQKIVDHPGEFGPPIFEEREKVLHSPELAVQRDSLGLERLLTSLRHDVREIGIWRLGADGPVLAATDEGEVGDLVHLA